MIKDMRRELASCQQDSWRLEEVTELGDMKERLFMSMLPRDSMSQGSEDENASVATGFAALSVLNDEMDEELDALMEKLGSVKNQFSSLDAQRRTLQVSRLSLPPAIHRCRSLHLYIHRRQSSVGAFSGSLGYGARVVEWSVLESQRVS
jgi:hypothetical protein